MRVFIIGGPRSGKTTMAAFLAKRHKLAHYCTDPLSLVKEPTDGVKYLPEGLYWGEDSDYIVSQWFPLDNVIIEGVGLARALRKFKGENPCDHIVVLPDAVVERTTGQEVMAKGVMTVWSEVSSKYKHLVR